MVRACVQKHLGFGLLLFLLAGCTGRQTAPTVTAVTPSPVYTSATTSPRPVTAVPPPAAHIRFETLTRTDGLSHNAILTIFQDSKGYLWLGTLNGLNKYDGYHFTVYEHDPNDPFSLSDNVVQAIFEDRDGILWFGTAKGGLNRFDRVSEQFTAYRHDPFEPNSLSSDEVTAVTQDQTGTLWIATFGGGLNRYDPLQDQFTHYTHNPQDPLSLSSNNVWSLLADTAGNVWAGTADAGLNRFDPRSGYFRRYTYHPDNSVTLSHNAVSALHQDRQGNLWAATYGGGLNLYNTAADSFTRYQYDPRSDHSLAGNNVIAIQEDLTGALWLGIAGKGIDRLNPEDGRFAHFPAEPNDPGGLPSSLVLALYVDRAGVLWVGTDGGGLAMHDLGGQLFAYYRPDVPGENGLNGNNVLAIWQDHLGILWVGTEAGLSKFYRGSNQFIYYGRQFAPPTQAAEPVNDDLLAQLGERPNRDADLLDSARGQAVLSLHNDQVQAIFEDSQDQIWVGTPHGLTLFNQVRENVATYRHNPHDPDSLMHDWVWAIQETEGCLWVGTAVGLDCLDRETGQFIHYRHDPLDATSLTSGDVRVIFVDSLGTLWVGTSGGLNRFVPQTQSFIRYQHNPANPASLGDNAILTMTQDATGILWVGTYSGGLNWFDPATGSFIRYLKKDGLPSNTVSGILPDEVGQLWLSTNNGLSRFNPVTQTFTNFDVRDGLQADEFNPHAAFRGLDGELFFGGPYGLNAFFPQQIREDLNAPAIVLTALTQSGVPLVTDAAADSLTAVTLHWPHNFLEFEFAALSFAQTDKNQYAYRLEGWEENWNYAGSLPFGRYTNLPAGTYTLRVKGSNSDGIWNETGTSLHLTVMPPFWQTWWFRAITAVLLAALVIGVFRLRLTAVQRRNRQLQQQVAERSHALAQRTLELERRRKVAEGLREILVRLNGNHALDESLHYIANQAAALTGAAEVVIFRRVPEAEIELLANSSGRPLNGAFSSYLPLLHQYWLDQPLEPGQPWLAPDLNTLESSTPEGAAPFRAAMGIPLIVEGSMFGGLLWLYRVTRSFTAEEVQLGFIFADQAALAVANDQLRGQAQETAVMRERHRLARDLHDAVTQTLFSASLIAEVLPTTWTSNQEKGEKLLVELNQLNRGAMAEMRTLLLELRPSALAEADLSHLLKQLGQTITGRTGIPATVQVEGLCPLPPPVHEALYRIAQEACNNIVKHAQAQQVQITLHCVAPENGADHEMHLCLRIKDDGCGFAPTAVPADHLGLAIMRERAEAIGAQFALVSQPGLGAEIIVRWRD